MQFIGKLMRQLEPRHWTRIRRHWRATHAASASETLALHQAEQWRDRLIADDDAFGQWISSTQAPTVQQLRALIRQARKDAKPDPCR
jgi:ribosome-associated protein